MQSIQRAGGRVRKLSYAAKQFEKSKKLIATIKDATIFEASHMGGLEGGAGGIGGPKDSFVLVFDTAEFDLQFIDEGCRPD